MSYLRPVEGCPVCREAQEWRRCPSESCPVHRSTLGSGRPAVEGIRSLGDKIAGTLGSKIAGILTALTFTTKWTKAQRNLSIGLLFVSIVSLW